MIDITDFGAIGDGVTDNTAVMQAAIEAVDKVSNRGTVVGVPAGEFYLAGDLHVDRSIILTGASTIGGGYSTLKFAPGHGIIVDYYNDYTAGGRGDYSIIENLTITSDFLPGFKSVVTPWQASSFYTLGVRVKAPGSEVYYFECTTAGKTGPNNPFGSGPYTKDATIPEGPDTLVWTTRFLSSTWLPNHCYNIGDRVKAVDENRYYFECETSGQSGTGPNDPFGSGGQTPGALISDHDPSPVRWKVKVANGIYLRARAYVRNCMIRGFTNCGVMVAASASAIPPNNANGWGLDHLVIVGCGVGVFVGGGDANAGLATALDVGNAGYEQPGLGGVGIWDHSFLSASWVACQVALSSAQNYRLDGNAAFSVMMGCYSEAGGLPDRVLSPAVVIGGHNGLFSADSTATRISSGSVGCAHLQIVDRKGTVGILVSPSLHDGSTVYSFGSDDEWGNTFGYRYQPSPKGWWAFGYGSQNASWMQLFSGAAAADGPGHWWDYRGHFRGSLSKKHYFGVDPGSLTDKQIRGGHFYPGDRFEGITSGTAGAFLGQVVTQEGYRGLPWSGNAVYGVRYRPWGIFSDQVEPTTPNGYVYRCTKAGKPDSSEPLWPTTIGPEAYTWASTEIGDKIGILVGDLVRPTLPNGHYYKCIGAGRIGPKEPAWPTGGTVKDQTTVVYPGVGQPVSADTLVEPDPPNGFYYKARNTGVTGGTEPVWSMIIGNYVQDHEVVWDVMGGLVEWEEAGSDGGTYVQDGQVIWTCIGRTPSYNNYGLIEDSTTVPKGVGQKARIQTTDATPTLLHLYPLPDNACTLVEVAVTAHRVDAAEGAVFKLSGSWDRFAGSAPVALISPKVIDFGPLGTAWAAVLVLTGSSVQVLVTGEANKTLNWSCVLTAQVGT